MKLKCGWQMERSFGMKGKFDKERERMQMNSTRGGEGLMRKMIQIRESRGF